MPKVRHTYPTKRTAKRVPKFKTSAQALLEAVQPATPVDESVPTAPPSGGSDPAPSPRKRPTGVAAIEALAPSSLVREKAMHIIAMRMAGMSKADIAKAVGIAERTVNQYVYIAGKNGWLANQENWADPADKLEYEVSHKVVRNLEAGLDQEHAAIVQGRLINKDSITAEVARGTLFKKFGDVAAQQPQAPNVLAIKIELPTTGSTDPVRVGAGGGTPRFVEAEVIDGSRVDSD